MAQEIWKNVVNYEKYYQVSNLGNIRSLDRIVKRNNRNYLRKGKILLKSINNLGYETIGLTINSKTINYRVHRLVAEAFIINYSQLRCVNHLDGNKTNNSVSNLEWCSYSDNSKHAYHNKLNLSMKINRLSEKGELNPNSKLTQKEVNEIRDKYVPFKYSTKKLAEEYKVSQSCIKHILNNSSWKN